MNGQLYALACGLLSMMTYTASCRADTVTDWDTKATAVASAAALGEREVAIVDLAMFDAVNSIERRFQPYLDQLPTTEPTSADAAAASAAATALAGLHPEAAASFKAALAEYLAHLSAAPEALANGGGSGRPLRSRSSRRAPTMARPQSIPTVPRPSRGSTSRPRSWCARPGQSCGRSPSPRHRSFAPLRRLR